MKLGLLALGAVSLVRLCLAYHQRLDRYGELNAILNLETSKLSSSQKRFDQLFTLGGDRRFIHEQEHWIEPNRLRVIWR